MTAATLGLGAYARSAAVTASPAEVVRMAYERILTACDRAADAEDVRAGGWVQRFHDETTRAQAILDGLISMLAVGDADPAVAAMSADLAAIYGYAMGELARANVHKDPEPLEGVHDAITGLLDAWRTAVLGRMTDVQERSEVGRWLDEMDVALVVGSPRLAALVERGLVLLADQPAGADLDRLTFQRVVNRLRDAADVVAGELAAVRRERGELARTGRAHAGYRAASIIP